jgi:hypothetical protein
MPTNPLAAAAQQMHVLAPGLLVHHHAPQAAFHVGNLRYHFTGTTAAIFVIVLAIVVVFVVRTLVRTFGSS